MPSPSTPIAISAPCRAYHFSHFPDPWIIETKPIRKARTPCTKFIERQVIRAWKRVTGATRKQPRASFLPKDFVLVTSRRRSVMFR